jgi:hypothetical protein
MNRSLPASRRAGAGRRVPRCCQWATSEAGRPAATDAALAASDTPSILRERPSTHASRRHSTTTTTTPLQAILISP